MTTAMRSLDVWEYFLPGIGLIRRGKRVGWLLFVTFVLTVVTILFNLSKILAVFDRPGLELIIADVYLCGILAMLYFLSINRISISENSPKQTGISTWRHGFQTLFRNQFARFGLIAVFGLFSIAVLAPILTPFEPNTQVDVLRNRFLPPSLDTGFLLGTDGFGRDLLSRIIYGARLSLTIGIMAVCISALIGVTVGMIAGYQGGWLDSALMRFVDLMLAFPRLFLVLIVIAFVGPSMFWVIMVLGFTGWMGVARLVRGEVLSLKEREFIQAAEAIGVSFPRLLWKHLLPNTLTPILVFLTLNIGNVILIEAGLSYLGLGVQPPAPSWGNIIDLGRQNLLDAWWISTFPGLAIVFTVLSFNIIGDAIREAFDPRMRDGQSEKNIA